MGAYSPRDRGVNLGEKQLHYEGVSHTAQRYKDCKGEINVMAHTIRNIVQVLSTDRITQLVLVPTIKAGQVLLSKARGVQGFGSSDVYWIQQIQKKDPN